MFICWSQALKKSNVIVHSTSLCKLLLRLWYMYAHLGLCVCFMALSCVLILSQKLVVEVQFHLNYGFHFHFVWVVSCMLYPLALSPMWQFFILVLLFYLSFLLDPDL